MSPSWCLPAGASLLVPLWLHSAQRIPCAISNPLCTALDAHELISLTKLHTSFGFPQIGRGPCSYQVLLPSAALLPDTLLLLPLPYLSQQLPDR